MGTGPETPRQQGYYMPAEWHPHAACWMAWPSSEATYQGAPEGRKITYAKAKIAYSKVGIRRFDCPLVLEGGGIHVDGEGTLLVTENCLLNKNRNPDLSKVQVEEYLQQYLNIRKIIWLNGNVPSDMTDGHIDGLACFIRPGVVLAASPTDESHPDYDVLLENLEILRHSSDEKGRPLEVVEIATPSRRLEKRHDPGCLLR